MTEISPLEHHLGYWLRFVSNQVSQSFGSKLAARGVSVAEWVLLREIYDAQGAPSTLATRLGMTRGAVTKIVDRLEASGLVKRATAKDDRRYQTLVLTQVGRALVPELAMIADENDRHFFGHLSTNEREALERTMKDIVHHLELRTVPVE